MPGVAQEDDAADSRTATIGSQTRKRGREPQASSSQSKKRKRGLTRRDIPEFVPTGSRFSASPLPVDKSSSENTSSDMENPDETDTQAQGGVQPTISWNPVNKGAIRTRLRSSAAAAQPASQPQPQSQPQPASTSNSFEAVNGRYWRGRSASASSVDPHGENPINGQKKQSQGETARTPNVISDSSDEWEAGEIDEGDDSIVLNMGAVDTAGAFDAASKGNAIGGSDDMDIDDVSGRGAQVNGRLDNAFPQVLTPDELAAHQKNKDAATRSFNLKYRTPPQTLSNLHRDDLERQAKYIFYTKPVEGLDLNLPIRCTDCLKEGHLAEICPDKECHHCGAWASHENRFCPIWRQCQRCRERGHDKKDCKSLLRELPSVVPCDLCASNQHTENQCDMMWKIPMPQSHSGQIFISVSCSHCASTEHLLGDCPRRPFEMKSSSWSLKTFDPSLLASHTPLADVQLPESATSGSGPQFKIKGRAAERVPSPDSDDALGRFGHSAPVKRDPPRGNIRIGAGIGRGRKPDHGPDDDYDDRSYRDREQYFGHNTRQRSASPPRQYSLRRGGGGGGGNGGGPSRRGPPPPPPSGRGGRGRGRPPPGRGRGKPPSNNSDSYRPMPSSGKKAWSRHRT